MMIVTCGGCGKEAQVPEIGRAGVTELQAFSDKHRPCLGKADLGGQPGLKFRYLDDVSKPVDGERIGER